MYLSLLVDPHVHHEATAPTAAALVDPGVARHQVPVPVGQGRIQLRSEVLVRHILDCATILLEGSQAHLARPVLVLHVV